MCLSIACSLSSSSPPTTEIVDTRGELAQEHTASSRQKRPRFYYELANDDDEDEGGGEGEEEEEDDASEDEEAAEGQRKGGRRRRRRRTRRTTKAFGQDAYLLPENFRSLRRKDIPVTYRLHDDLLRYYRKGTRPVTHPSKIISVSMSVFLYQIIKLDAVKNTISLSGSFELYWQDEFLQWDPDSYEGAAEIFLASTDIWIPEFSLYYSVNFNDAVKLQSNNDVRVNYTGHVRYWIPFSTESLCNSVDVKFFPFDIQRCTLLLGSWAHSNDSIKYSLYSKNLSLIDFYDNQEWQLDLSQSHITSDGFLYDYLDPPLFWEMIVIDLVVSRQSFYYVFNLVIPSAIITLVAVIGFHTPSTSGKMRDAKFRLGIMTLMSMSMILLAIVEDMPKFSISSSRKGRGSFSGIPLIGLYYFMLLAIVGLSTVTSSMFVFVERNVRIHHYIPFYLRWMIAIEQRKRNFSKRYSFRGSRNKRKAAEAKRQQQQQQDGGGEMDTLLFSPHAESATTPHGHLNGFVGLVGGSDSNLLAEGQNSRRTKRVAMSLLRLIATDKDRGDTVVPPRHSQSGHFRQSAPRGSAGRLKGRSAERLSQQDLDSPTRHSSATRNPPSPFQRKRHSLLHYDSMAVYQCYQQLVEELALGLCRVERTVLGIRQDLAAMVPQNDMESDWQKAIRRLELLSLVFYVTLLFATMLLFFYHDWYCAIGHNPCGQQNLKCPWLVSDPSQPSCLT